MGAWEEYSENDRYWYWFVNLKGTGSLTRRRLLQIFGHPASVYRASKEDLSPILKRDQLSYCFQSRNMDAISASMKRLSQERTRFIHWESPDYPARLKKLSDPPLGLYLRGRLPDPCLPSVAMIGSRKATGYGMNAAEYFARVLAEYHIQIISGLAEGIDASSHRGALKGHGYTLGILGGGIDSIYPRANFNLYMDMYQRGGVLSEWNLGIPNHPGLFPVRNRLISGLSDAVFVLEAARKSGSFITVDQALEQGRTVFALPGRITDANSVGTNLLISEGAVPVMHPDDILDYLRQEGYSLYEKNSASANALNSVTALSFVNKGKAFKNKEQENVYHILDEKEPKDFAVLMDLSGYSITRLSHILYELELLGWISQPRQNVYLKKI